MKRFSKAQSGLKRLPLLLSAAAVILLVASSASAEPFTYNPPGDLVSGSGTGRVDNKEYVPNMRFPLESGPAFANSQVYGHGGFLGPGGGQCDSNNYSYPWHDNYCESRQWSVPLCPSGTGHQGQDIRPATCTKSKHWAVAAESGTITNIGSYSVYLSGDSGTRHRYLHLDMGALAVSNGQRVSKGQRIGKVSNDFGGTATTIHVHYDLNQHVSGIGKTYVPTYMSLVRSYERLIGAAGSGCESVPAAGATIDDNSPCFRLHGPPSTWRYVTGTGHAGALNWTRGWPSSEPANWAEWQLDIDAAGRYRVEIWTDSPYASSRQAPFAIRASGQELQFDHDFTSQGAGWQSLGEYDFAAGGDQWVHVFDNSGEASSLDRRIQADALRIVPVSTNPDPDPEPNPDPEPQPEPVQPLPPCHLPGDGGIIDDKESDCFSLFGPSKYWRMVSDGYDNNLYWTKAFAGSSTSNWAQFTFQVSETGRYRVQIYNVPAYGSSRRARWELEFAGSTHPLNADLTGQNGWVGLVELDLSPGQNIELRLRDNTGEHSSLGRRLSVDAIRLERISDEPGGGTNILAIESSPEGAESEWDESPNGKGFVGETPGVPLPGDAPLNEDAQAPADPREIDGACECSSVRAGESSLPLGAPVLILGAMLFGLGVRRFRSLDH